MRLSSILHPILAVLVVGLAACGDKGTTSDAASTASATATSSAAAKSDKKKTVKIKRTQDECTFEFEAPEELKETAKDGVSFTLEGSSFAFIGYVGQSLKSEPSHPLDMFKDDYEVLHTGTEKGVGLKIVKAKKPNPGAKPTTAISGWGSELYRSGYSLGCGFSCEGVAEREADVIAMCKSVKMTVAEVKE
jgi:hypothetical protein